MRLVSAILFLSVLQFTASVSSAGEILKWGVVTAQKSPVLGSYIVENRKLRMRIKLAIGSAANHTCETSGFPGGDFVDIKDASYDIVQPMGKTLTLHAMQGASCAYLIELLQ